MVVRLLLCFAIALVAASCRGTASGHEVDQYSVPAGEPLLDMRGYWNDLLYEAVSRAVRETNEDIAAEQRAWIPDVGGMRSTQRQSPETLTKNVSSQFPTALALIETLEANLAVTDYRDAQSGHRLAYRAKARDSVYGKGPIVPDPRHWNRLLFMRCSTIKVHGHHLGTDKIGHFTAMGYHYYRAYRASRLVGQSHENSLANACAICGSLTENSFLGSLSTGIYSNADLAANYLGLKFYLNVTRPVRLGGQTVPPMVIRNGDYWKLSPHFTPNCPLLAMFVSVHWDEALNPSYLDFTARNQTRKAIQLRSQQLLDWYAGQDPRRRNPEYFNNLLQHCRQYFGEDYGHAGKHSELLCLGTICFGSGQDSASGPVVRANRSSNIWGRAAEWKSTSRKKMKPHGDPHSRKPVAAFDAWR